MRSYILTNLLVFQQFLSILIFFFLVKLFSPSIFFYSKRLKYSKNALERILTHENAKGQLRTSYFLER